MVNLKFIFPALSVLVLGSGAQAAAFTAQVDHRTVGLGDTLDLRLALEDAAPTGAPDLTALGESFRVLGQQQSSETRVINGAASSRTVWDIALSPLQAGSATIPALAVGTQAGMERSEPISIQVSAGAAPGKTASAPSGIHFQARASETKPYRDQPVLVTYRMTATRPIRNLQLGDFHVPNAIVELQGQPKVETSVVRGQEREDLTITYLVTPLRDGALTLPPYILRGEAPVASRPQPSPDEDDPFSEMEQMMGNFGAGSGLFADLAPMKPVTIVSNPVSLQVQPAVAGITPWLPAQSVMLTESWGSDSPRVGEPLIRTIRTQAIGVAPSQLPGFDDRVADASDFRIYPDPPRLSTSRANGTIVAERIDRLTLVPQKSGELKLPPLKVDWWDTLHHVARVAALPGRSIQVLAGAGGQKIIPPPVVPAPRVASVAPFETHAFAWEVVGGALVLLIFGFVLFIWRSRRAPTKFAANAPSISVPSPAAPGPRDLEKCGSASDLRSFLQQYASARWEAPPNLTLARLFSLGQTRLAGFDVERARKLVRRMENALYAGQPESIDEMRVEIMALIFRKANRPDSRPATRGLPELNPT